MGSSHHMSKFNHSRRRNATENYQSGRGVWHDVIKFVTPFTPAKTISLTKTKTTSIHSDNHKVDYELNRSSVITQWLDGKFTSHVKVQSQ
jgi:hypothetical protein